MGKGRDWNVDLIPKFLMANGKKQQQRPTLNLHFRLHFLESVISANTQHVLDRSAPGAAQSLGHTYPVA